MFCRYCGNPSETPVCPTCAAQIPAPQPEYAQPVVPAQPEYYVQPECVQPEAPAPVTPEEAAPAPILSEETQVLTPEMAQSVMFTSEPAQNYVPAYAPVMEPGDTQPPQKKKGGKKVLLSILAVVCAVAVGLGVFTYLNPHWYQSPEDYMQEITQESLSSYTDTLSSVYGTLFKGESLLEGDYNTATTKLSLELDPSIAALLSSALQSEGIEMDAASLQNISLNAESTIQDNLMYVALSTGASADKIIGIKAFADLQTSVAYLGIPALSDTYLEVDLSQYDVDLSQLLTGNIFALEGDMMGAEYTAMLNALPSEDDFNVMLDTFLTSALEQITQVEKTSETVMVGGHSQSQTVLSATISEATLLQMGKVLLQQAQTNATLKSMLDAIDQYVYDTTGERMNLYSELVANAPALISQLDQLIAQANPTNYVLFKTYVDGDEVLGYDLSVVSAGSMVNALAFNVVEDGGTHYFQMTIPATGTNAPVLSGSYVENGDDVKGEMILPIEGLDFSIAFDSTATSTTLRLTPPAQLMNQLLPEMNAGGLLTDNLALELTMNHPDDANYSVRYAVLMGNTSMVALKAEMVMGNTTIALPQDTANVEDQMALMLWASEAYGNLPGLLEDLGLSEEAISDLMGDLL